MRRLMVAAGFVLATALVAAPGVAKKKKESVRAVAMPGEMVLYELRNFQGDRYSVTNDRTSLSTEWNIGSIAMVSGERWQICAKPRFRDPCMVVSQSIPDASTVGIHGQIGSARKAPAQ